MPAGQPAAITASPSAADSRAQREATSTSATITPPTRDMPTADAPSAPAKKTASHGKKRKAVDTDDAVTAKPLKKTKKETVKAAPKPRHPRKSKKKIPEEPADPSLPMPPELSAPLRAKIAAVKRFLATEMAQEGSKLIRDLRHHVSIPELDLLSVIMTLYFHYQLDHAETEASLSDVDGAITSRFIAPLRSAGDVKWVTLDLSKTTKIQERTNQKIANHGLDDTNLLEVELELAARRNLAAVKKYKWDAERAMLTAEQWQEVVAAAKEQEVKENIIAAEQEERLAAAEALHNDKHGGPEVGRRGVCPAPAIEVV